MLHLFLRIGRGWPLRATHEQGAGMLGIHTQGDFVVLGETHEIIRVVDVRAIHHAFDGTFSLAHLDLHGSRDDLNVSHRLALAILHGKNSLRQPCKVVALHVGAGETVLQLLELSDVVDLTTDAEPAHIVDDGLAHVVQGAAFATFTEAVESV